MVLNVEAETRYTNSDCMYMVGNWLLKLTWEWDHLCYV